VLSYQHAYHAGCLADVHKHAVLVHILQHLVAKFPRITYVDTHSGRGMYRLNSAEAKKTGEAENGIVQLMKQQKLANQPLADILRQIRGKLGKDAYPGSPAIAEKILRTRDKMHLFELHPAEFAALQRNFSARNIRSYAFDGYEGTAQLCPPSPHNGLVLIDPSFEVKSEYMLAADFVQHIVPEWQQGVVLLWYPMLKANNHEPMVAALEKAGLPGYWHQEIRFYDPEAVRGLYGSGVVAVNLPNELPPRLESVREIFY
jgi:23S rRNA (adenine2030-N6)-methyltransferase